MRTLPTGVLASIFALQTTDAFIALLEVSHPDWSTTYRFARNTEDIVHDGDTFEARAFAGDLPPDAEQRGAVVNLIVDNVDLTFGQALLSVNTAPTAIIKIVRPVDPDTIVYGPFTYKIREYTVTARVAAMSAAFATVLSGPYPAHKKGPNLDPGAFSTASGDRA